MSALRQVKLHPQTAAMLRRPINGRGGFQSLMRRIQLGLQGRTLKVSQDDLDALIRAVSGPGKGGFQQRARSILLDVIVHELAPEPPRRSAKVLRFNHGQRGLPFGGGL
jgi:hypothetical protein